MDFYFFRFFFDNSLASRIFLPSGLFVLMGVTSARGLLPVTHAFRMLSTQQEPRLGGKIQGSGKFKGTYNRYGCTALEV